MLFTSYNFIIFALVLIILYYTVPKRLQGLLLLGASIVFYLCSGPDNLIYISITAVSTYFTALSIDKNAEKRREYLKENRDMLTFEQRKSYKERMKKQDKRRATICIVLNLSILAGAKYLNFFIQGINGISELFKIQPGLSFVKLALPLGISFYTFQSIGYLVDVYRGTVRAERSFLGFALFISYFPQLIQGPISRFGDLKESLLSCHSFSREGLCLGLERVLWGYFKKLVIADRALIAVSRVVNELNIYEGAYVVFATGLYSLQLYADFTGGIDICIGLSQALGIELKENFMRPYFSKSLKEYWRRWHISMGSWFRDYVFYPLSVSEPMQRLTRLTRRRLGNAAGKRIPLYISSFAVWFLTGLWHGAGWNYILWGLFNWAVLMLSQEAEPLYKSFHRRFPYLQGRGAKLFQVLRTLVIVAALHLFDLYKSPGESFYALSSMFTAGNYRLLFDGSLLNLGLSTADYAILAAGGALMLVVSLIQRKGSVRRRIAKLSPWRRFALWFGLFLIVLLTGIYGAGYNESLFIYSSF